MNHARRHESSVFRSRRAFALGRWLAMGASLTLLALAAMWFALQGQTPQSAEEWVERGRRAMERRDYRTSRTSFEQAVQRDPELAKAWALLAEAACLDQHQDQALAALQEVVRREPKRGWALGIKLARIWVGQHRYQPAIQGARLAAEADPASPEPERILAQIYSITGHREEVVTNLVDLIRKNSFSRDDLIVLSAATPCRDAPEERQQALKAAPEFRAPLLQGAFSQMGDKPEAAELLLLELTAAVPGDDEAQGALGELYAAQFPKKFLKWNARLSPGAENNSRIWAARGRWLARMGSVGPAIRCLHESLIREPEQLATTMLLGGLLKSLDEIELGNAFSERGLHLQRIIDMSIRMNDPRGDELVIPLIEELEAVGRLWEAWGWCVVYEQQHGPQISPVAKFKSRIRTRLHRDLPRTDPLSLPGQGSDWERFPLPDWNQPPVSDAATEVMSASSSASGNDSDAAGIQFVDKAEEAGLRFRFVNSYSPAAGRMIFESMGSGVAVLDYDRDGWPDLYFPQGNTSPTRGSATVCDELYRNLWGQEYRQVSGLSGVSESSYSQGVAAGDFDNDGFTDLYVANLGRNSLLRNNGDGSFTDVTEVAGLKQEIWTVSCAIADLNGDGFPELFDVNYLQGPDLLTGYCLDPYGRRTVCRPTAFDPTWNTVSINHGDGRFEEQQRECGLDLPYGRGLGLIVADFNEDDRLDVFVANDMSANFLLINQQTGPDQPLHFQDEAILRNVALDEFGLAQACMGIACADINRDRLPDLYITNFARESNTLYRSQAGGFYQDATQSSQLRGPGFDLLGFGTQFMDADNDGWEDLIVVNGHLDQFINEPFQMRAQFFRGKTNSQFVELSGSQAGEIFARPRLGRGLAVLDWNRDGRVDFIATDLEQAAVLGVNTTPSENRTLAIRLVGTRSNRDGIGAKIGVTVTPTDHRYLQRVAGDGYESSNEQVLRIGTGKHANVEAVEISWPSGEKSRATHVSTDSEWLFIEGDGAPISLKVVPK